MLGLISMYMNARNWPYISILFPNCVIATDVKSCTYCCYVRCTTLIVQIGGMPCPNSLPCLVMTSIRRLYNQRVVCLLCSIARINDVYQKCTLLIKFSNILIILKSKYDLQNQCSHLQIEGNLE